MKRLRQRYDSAFVGDVVTDVLEKLVEGSQEKNASLRRASAEVGSACV